MFIQGFVLICVNFEGKSSCCTAGDDVMVQEKVSRDWLIKKRDNQSLNNLVILESWQGKGYIIANHR
jgi:hypothetical protein